MKTLTAHEAIAAAEKFDVLVFSRDFGRQVSAAQAKQLIELNQRDPELFVLENWPDSDKEADDFLLRCFHNAMITEDRMTATARELCSSAVSGPAMHPSAAELAARRLVEQQLLEVVQEDGPEVRYRLPRNIRFKESFLDELRSRVCHECAHLNPDKAFHKTCLNALMDFLINADFRLSDVTVVGDPEEGGKLPGFVQRVNTRWLSQTVSATRGKLRSVVGPILARESGVESERTQDTAAEPFIRPSVVKNTRTPDGDVANLGFVDLGEIDLTAIQSKQKISKTELIAYLHSVQIVDEDGEIAELKAECARLRSQLEEKDYDLLQLEREKGYLKKQCDDIQRDMDTLLEAMQIAKRRGHAPAQVIDADIRD